MFYISNSSYIYIYTVYKYIAFPPKLLSDFTMARGGIGLFLSFLQLALHRLVLGLKTSVVPTERSKESAVYCSVTRFAHFSEVQEMTVEKLRALEFVMFWCSKKFHFRNEPFIRINMPKNASLRHGSFHPRSSRSGATWLETWALEPWNEMTQSGFIG